MEETKKQQPRLRRRASGIYIPEQSIPSTTNTNIPRPSTAGFSSKTHSASAYNNNEDNRSNPNPSFSMKQNEHYGEDPADPHPTMKITSLAKPVTFTTTGHGILNVLPVSSLPSHYANDNRGNYSARSCQSGSQKSSSSHPMAPTSTSPNHPPSHFASSSPRIKSSVAASSYNNKPLRQNFIKHGKKSSSKSNSVNIDLVPEAKPTKHPSRSNNNNNNNSNCKKQFISNSNEQRERSLQIRKMYKNTTNFYIENETAGQFTGTGRTTKTNSNAADFPTRTASPPLSFQRSTEGDGGDCIEIQKSVSRCTVDGLGFDLETIDLTNDTDRELASTSTAKYKNRRKSTKTSSKTNKSPDSATRDWCPDNFSNSDIISKELPDSSTSSASSSGSGTGSGTASSDDDNDNSLDSDIETKNRNKPASRYISVESLVLQDNFNALTSTSSTKSSSTSRSRATGGGGTLPISAAAAAGKNKLKQKQQQQLSDDSILDSNNSENSDDHDQDNEDTATIINEHINNKQEGNFLEFSASDEIPQVKVVWTTPPQQRSPRLVNGAVVETPLTSPSSTADPQSISILDFFTRTEEGVIKEGRYENVEPIISKFFNKSDEENSNTNTAVANSCINLKNVMDNMDEFVLQPAAVGYDIQCRVTRDRKGVDRGLYPTYYMHLERPDGRKVLLLTGRKRKKSTTSNYLISTDAADLSRDSNHYVGKVRSNLLGTQFTIYDNGQSHKRLGLFQTYGANATLTREELAAVIYEPNVLGFKGPRKMKILIPEMKNEAKRREHRPEKEKDSVLELFKQGGQQEYFELRNKAPIWNDDNQSFVLNFHGRVTQASVKNFQIIHENKEEYVILQFGRVASDLFTMDYRFPLCALQAFAIVLTSFDNKLACE